MAKYVDLIKGLALRFEKSQGHNRKLGKVERQLLKDIRSNFKYIYRQDNDITFQEEFFELMSNQWTKPYIIANFFSQDYDDYAAYTPCCDFTNNLRFELRWLVFNLKYYAKVISEFVSIREEYDSCVLLNKYEDALQIVNNAEEKFGVSFWSGECKCFLYSKSEKDINELLVDLPQTVIGAIFDYYDLKNRENVTSDEYFYIVNRQIRYMNQIENKVNSIVEFFKYTVQSIMYSPSKQSIMYLLEFIRKTSLIDQYIFFIDMCDYAISKPEEDEIFLNVKAYIKELSAIEDEHLTALRFLFDSKENRKNNYALKNKLETAKEEFIKGNLLQARAQAIELLKKSPCNVEAINLYIDTNILIGDSLEEFAGTNLGNLITKLQSVYILSSSRDDDIDEINKLTNCLSFSSWAKSIRNSIINRCQEYAENSVSKEEMLANLQYLDIETMIAGLPANECIEFINEKLDLNNQYIKFRKACCEQKFEIASELCQVKQIKDLMFVYDEKNSIQEKILHLGKIEGNDAAIAIKRIKYFVSTIDLEENYEIISSICSQLMIDNIFASLFIPLKRIVDYIDNAGEDIRKSIYSPILYYIYADFYNKDKRDDLGIICEDYFFYNNITRPTEMEIDLDKYSTGIFIFFLRYICIPKIMDLAIIDFTNSQERDQERVEICNKLCQIDPDNVDEYEKEIREITRKLMISKEIKTIEENRIHVNIDGIKENLIQKYKNDFLRYKFYVNKKTKQWVNSQYTSFFEEGPERILHELIIHIRDAFVSSNEYGLDGYLSLNIRHGTLADELRSPIYKSMLSARKDIDTGKYVINQYWNKRISQSDLDIITKAISEFFIETETIITKLKEQYIQIRTEEKNENGLFDYRLSGLRIDLLPNVADKSDTFEEFLDIVISAMWEVTENNLLRVKDTINSEIAENYNKAFNTLKLKIADVKNKDKARDLLQKINEASTDMPNVLNKICYWFQRSTESKHNDFDLQFAFDLGLETIKNMHPEKNFIAKPLEETKSDKISGYFLKDYDGIFYNMFNNIYKNAYSKDNRNIEIRYILKNQGGKQFIYLENDYDCQKDMSTELKKVKKAKELIRTGKYIERITGEGGTGIPKICKIISYDIGNPAMIDFDYIIEENKFFIELNFG